MIMGNTIVQSAEGGLQYIPPSSLQIPTYRPGMSPQFFDPNADPNQNMIFWDIYIHLKQLALNVVEYINVPETIDKRFLYNTIFEQGYCLFFQLNPEDLMPGVQTDIGIAFPGEYIVLPATFSGEMSIYNIPVNRTGIAVGGQRFNRTNEDSVIIWGNYARVPMSYTVYRYAQQLTNILEKIDVNLFATSQPPIIKGSKAQITSLKSMVSKVGKNAYYMIIDKDTDLTDMFGVFNPDAKYMVNDLRIEYNAIWNEALSRIGYRNVPFQKSSALIKSEVAAENESTIAMRDSAFGAQYDAIQEINAMFGLNIGIRYRMEGILEENPMLRTDYFGSSQNPMDTRDPEEPGNDLDDDADEEPPTDGEEE